MLDQTVFELCSGIPSHKNHCVYADNLFTTEALVEELLKRGIFYLGTVRNNRIKGAHAELKTEKELSSLGRGSFDCVHNETTACVRWYDNRAVTLMTTYCNVEEGNVDRYERREKRTVSIPMPSCISEYNKFMGGIDLLDCLTAKVHIRLLSKRWYMYLFYHMIKCVVVNSWLLYRNDCSLICPGQKTKKLKEFLMSLHFSLAYKDKRAVGIPSKRMRLSAGDVRNDRYDHFPQYTESQAMQTLHQQQDFCHLSKMPSSPVLCERT